MDAVKKRHGVTQTLWINLCRFFVRAFYRKVEIHNADQLKEKRAMILCANHSNALADAVLLQYCSRHLIHPIARSGLFKNIFMRIILNIWQAIPVYRRQDSPDGTVDNDAMFNKVFEILHTNEIIMIFPEGQSHSDSQLRDIRSGISRIALGYKNRYRQPPVILPVGLNFSGNNYFRSNVFINIGEPLEISDELTIDNDADVRQLTEQVRSAMKEMIIEADKKDDLVFAEQVARFFSLRHKSLRKQNLRQKYNSQKMLLTVKNLLVDIVPDKLAHFRRHLLQFNRLCRRLGINDYNLNISYNSRTVFRFILRSILVITLMLPLGIIGFMHSFIPYLLTRAVANKFAATEDQQDTSKILVGTFLFSLFWSLQSWYVINHYSVMLAVLYIVSIIPTSLIALIIFHEQARIIDNLKVFLILVRSHYLRRYLLRKRKSLEKEMAELLKIARQHRKRSIT